MPEGKNLGCPKTRGKKFKNGLLEEQAESVASCWEQARRVNGKKVQWEEKLGARIVNCCGNGEDLAAVGGRERA